MGDVLRELDNRLSSDFVLMSGDTVANVDLSRAIALHKERRIKDKSIIMTMVCSFSFTLAARQGSFSSACCAVRIFKTDYLDKTRSFF